MSEKPLFLSTTFAISGKLGKPDIDDPLGVYGIYQRRRNARGTHTVKMRFYTPTNPETPAQQANREKFAAAVAAWVALTPEQKKSYTTRAKRRQMFGWGLFIREYYQAN